MSKYMDESSFALITGRISGNTTQFGEQIRREIFRQTAGLAEKIRRSVQAQLRGAAITKSASDPHLKHSAAPAE
ncbi:MAG: hypothetical protein ACLT1T_07775 [Oscillospiraceae bacterium]